MAAVVFAMLLGAVTALVPTQHFSTLTKQPTRVVRSSTTTRHFNSTTSCRSQARNTAVNMVFGRTKKSQKSFVPAVSQTELKPGTSSYLSSFALGYFRRPTTTVHVGRSSLARFRRCSFPITTTTGGAVSAICSGLDICIAVDTDGSVYAMGNKSPVLGTPMAIGPVKAGKIKDPITGTSFSLKTGEVVGPWCPNFPFSFLFALIEPAGLPVFKCKTSGGAVSVEVDINAKTNFESGYWKGILDAKGKATGEYY